MSTDLKLPIGTEFFSEFRRDGYYYIDKTEFIKTLIDNAGKVNLFTRPRRFGKTLTMSMLKSFFEIGTDKSLFDGLAICRYTEICEKYMGRYPVISLSLKSVDGISFENAFGMLGEIIWRVFVEHSYLLDSTEIMPFEKKMLERMLDKEASQSEMLSSLQILSSMLAKHYGKPVIILIDECDVPLQKAIEKGYYDEMIQAIRALLNEALKTNGSLFFSVMTGCLRISKESIFTGLNNLKVDMVIDSKFNGYFGFTRPEVARLLADYDISFAMEQLTEWYDGYNFGGEKMYCPWDVLNQCDFLRQNPQGSARMYWENTSENEVIKRFIKVSDSGVRREIEKLIDGGTVVKPLNESLTYKDYTSNIDNLYNVMLMTGYLTAADDRINDYTSVRLRIPNCEIRDLFIRKIREWFSEVTPVSEKRELLEALWRRDVGKVETTLGRTLLTTISYYDYQDDKTANKSLLRESFYHGFLVGLLVCEGYGVSSNKEYGLGRDDVLVIDDGNKRVLLIEVKSFKKKTDTLEDLCRSAIEQIHAKKYLEQFKRDGYDVAEYAMAFVQKSCMLRLAD